MDTRTDATARRRRRPLAALLAAAMIAFGLATVAVGAGTAGAAVACPTDGATPPAATATVTTATAVLGGTIHLSGANWCHPDGTGSTLAVKIDAGGIKHLEGQGPHTNVEVWAIVQADGNGTVEADITLPTATNSTPAFANGQHTLTLLTGSIKTGDTRRSVLTNPFTVADPPPPTCNAAATATATVDTATAPIGGTVHLTGANWCHPDGTGSTLAVKIGDLKHLDGEGVNPNLSVWAVVPADATGAVDAYIQLPTAANSTPAFTPGSWALTLLTGGLKTGDTRRTVTTNTFAVTALPVTEPTYPHVTVSAGPAIGWVQQNITAGGELKISGAGWLNEAGTGGSTIAIKLNSEDGQFTRSGADVISHPTAGPDPTIWELVTANADGSFEITSDAPTGIVGGDKVTVQFQSGLLAAGDVTRSVTSAALVVDGVPWVDPGPGEGEDKCVATGAASVAIPTPAAEVGGTLRVTGSNWCHPDAGGSTIAVKINEGGFSHLAGQGVHPNLTIWAIIEVDSTGSFDTEIQLPTASNSTPAFVPATYTLRLLTGSLKANDLIRSELSPEFVVVAEGTLDPDGPPPALGKPTSTPDPWEYNDDLVDSARGGITATLTGTTLDITIPAATPGDWVFVYVFSSPKTVDWFQVGAANSISVSIAGMALEPGVHKVSVQNRAGALMGWDDFTLATASGGSGSTLAKTGADTDTLALGLLVTGLGVLLLSASRIGGARSRAKAAR